MQLTFIPRFPRSIRMSLAGLALASLALPALAQGLFSPAITVGNDVITNYELEQREQFLRLLRTPGDPVQVAREELIRDRLKLRVASEAGITASPDEVEAGMEEFAQRVDLTREEFIAVLEDNGVSAQTFRAFANSGIVWREYVRARFLRQARPSEAEIDRALGSGGTGINGVRVLLSEIIIPITPQTIDQVEVEADRIAQLQSFSAFSAEAERFSASESRQRGGRLDWLPLSQLPSSLQPVILALSPGEITEPIRLQQAIALFQLRDIGEVATREPDYAAIEYATYFIQGGRTAETLARAADISGQVDTCDDLYGVAQGQPPEILDRQSLPPGEIPRDVALELAKLDDNEISTALTRSNGQTLMVLMLCGRTASITDAPIVEADAGADGEEGEDATSAAETRTQVANALTQQRLNALAEGFLQQLEAEAVITTQ
ncbi:MAG: peptidylprolyl isomerase [Pseudomonadota bacterium]